MKPQPKKVWDSKSRSYVDAEDPFAPLINIPTGIKHHPKPATPNEVKYQPKRRFKLTPVPKSTKAPKPSKASKLYDDKKKGHYGSGGSKPSNQLIMKKCSIHHSQAQIIRSAQYIAGLSNDKNDDVILTHYAPGFSDIEHSDPDGKRVMINDFISGFEKNSKRAQTMHLIFHVKAECKDPRKATEALVESWKQTVEKCRHSWMIDDECLIAQHPEQRKGPNGERNFPHIHVLCRYQDLNRAKMYELREEMTLLMRMRGYELDDPKRFDKTLYPEHEKPDRLMTIEEIIRRESDGKVDQIKLRSSNGKPSRVRGIDLDRICNDNNLCIGDKILLKTEKENLPNGKHKNHFSLSQLERAKKIIEEKVEELKVVEEAAEEKVDKEKVVIKKKKPEKPSGREGYIRVLESVKNKFRSLFSQKQPIQTKAEQEASQSTQKPTPQPIAPKPAAPKKSTSQQSRIEKENKERKEKECEEWWNRNFKKPYVIFVKYSEKLNRTNEKLEFETYEEAREWLLVKCKRPLNKLLDKEEYSNKFDTYIKELPNTGGMLEFSARLFNKEEYIKTRSAMKQKKGENFEMDKQKMMDEAYERVQKKIAEISPSLQKNLPSQNKSKNLGSQDMRDRGI